MVVVAVVVGIVWAVVVGTVVTVGIVVFGMVVVGIAFALRIVFGIVVKVAIWFRMLATWARQKYGGHNRPWHKIRVNGKAVCGRVDLHPGRTEFHVGDVPEGRVCKLCYPEAEAH
jgi:hypothetical protein